MRRKDGSVDFDRNWVDYENRFGNLAGEFWIGEYTGCYVGIYAE